MRERLQTSGHDTQQKVPTEPKFHLFVFCKGGGVLCLLVTMESKGLKAKVLQDPKKQIGHILLYSAPALQLP